MTAFHSSPRMLGQKQDKFWLTVGFCALTAALIFLPFYLLDGGFLPVVAPVASGPEGQALNINADTAAGAVAGALHADYFVLISDVPGVLDADKKLIPSLDRARIAELIEAGVINGGMIPKVQSCLHALDEGCSRALILDGRQPSSLRRYLLDGEPLGTVVTA
jgi:acetylglutamate kinase